MEIFFTNNRVGRSKHNACREKFERHGYSAQNDSDRPQSARFSRQTTERLDRLNRRRFGDRKFHVRAEKESNFGQSGSRRSGKYRFWEKKKSRNLSNHSQPCRNRGGW